MTDTYNYILKFTDSNAKHHFRIGSHDSLLIGEVLCLQLNHDDPLDQSLIYINAIHVPTDLGLIPTLHGTLIDSAINVWVNGL